MLPVARAHDLAVTGVDWLNRTGYGELTKRSIVVLTNVVAKGPGMERIERVVYRRWVDRDEVRGMRESMTMLMAPNNKLGPWPRMDGCDR